VDVSILENNDAFRTASFDLRLKSDQDRWQIGRSYTASNLKHLETAAREARSRIRTRYQAHAPKPAPQR